MVNSHKTTLKLKRVEIRFNKELYSLIPEMQSMDHTIWCGALGIAGRNRLPPELVEEIIGFVLRPDWRTCKRHEAELIEENNGYVFYCLEQRRDNWSWREEAYHEVDDWTLYGRTWLMNAHQGLCIAQLRPPHIPPADGYYTDNYWKWYSHQIQWMNG